MSDTLFVETLPEQSKPRIVIPLNVTDIRDDGVIHDLRLAEQLGIRRDRNIRQLIERHADNLKRFGELLYRTANNRGPGPRTIEYYLNRKQALFIIGKSDAPNAVEIQILVIEVFDAWLSGKLRPVDAETETGLADATARAFDASPELMAVLTETRNDQRISRALLTDMFTDLWRFFKRDPEAIAAWLRKIEEPPKQPSSDRPPLAEPRIERN